MFIRIIAIALLLAGSALSASAATFYVNTQLDTPDAAPGNGVCANFGQLCSLRAAITEANALPSNDTIVIPGWVLTTTMNGTPEDNNNSGDYDIYGNLTIQGAGSGSTIIQAASSAGVAPERVFDIHAGAVVSMAGVTIRYGESGTNVPYWGGGINSAGTLTLTSCVVSDNEAKIYRNVTDAAMGGGIYSTGSLALNGVTVTNNKVTRTHPVGGFDEGGGIGASGNVNITNSNISNNRIVSVTGAGLGVGLVLLSQFHAVINGTNISNNTSSAPGGISGGGIAAWSSGPTSTLNISNSTIVQNSGTGGSNNQGGGLHLFSFSGSLSSSIDHCTISGNSVYGASAMGGGIFSGSNGGSNALTISNSTVWGNYSMGSGGGTYFATFQDNSASAGNYYLLNDTISDNAANQNGGGVYAVQSNFGQTFQTTLNFTTVAANIGNYDNAGAEGGGGIFTNASVFVVKNSVVGTNATLGTGYGPDIIGNLISYHYNRIGNLSGGALLFSSNDTIGNPLLGNLANNGGTTLTRSPVGGSPLIDRIPAGVNGCGTEVLRDQIGRPRLDYSLCDIGAVETVGVR